MIYIINSLWLGFPKLPLTYLILLILFLTKKLLTYRFDDSLLIISQAFEFWVDVNDVFNNHIIKQYFHDRDWGILMKFSKALIYTYLKEPMIQYFGNLGYVIITFIQTLKSAFANVALHFKMLPPKENYISYYHQISFVDTIYKLYKKPFRFFIMEHFESSFKDTTQLASIFLCLPLEGYHKYWFPHIKLPIPTN